MFNRRGNSYTYAIQRFLHLEDLLVKIAPRHFRSYYQSWRGLRDGRKRPFPRACWRSMWRGPRLGRATTWSSSPTNHSCSSTWWKTRGSTCWWYERKWLKQMGSYRLAGKRRVIRSHLSHMKCHDLNFLTRYSRTLLDITRLGVVTHILTEHIVGKVVANFIFYNAP